MPALMIRQDLSASELRRLARHEPDRRAGMRLLAIANALDGFSRAEAARLAGMERQALRDAVLRYNAQGPAGLHDRPRSGRPEALGPGQQAALKAWILPHPMPPAAWGPRRGPDPEKDGVSAWRLVDVGAQAERAHGVRYSAWGMSRLLERLGLSRQKTRPRHPQGRAAERTACEKWAWRDARNARRGASGRAAAARVRGRLTAARSTGRAEGPDLPSLAPARRAPARAGRQAVRAPPSVRRLPARRRPGLRPGPARGDHQDDEPCERCSQVLAGFAAQLKPGVHAVRLLDPAGWHGGGRLVAPAHVTLVPLPACRPELNPVERVWLCLRERHLSPRVRRDHAAVLDAVCRAWNALAAEAGRLASLTAYPYLLRSELLEPV